MNTRRLAASKMEDQERKQRKLERKQAARQIQMQGFACERFHKTIEIKKPLTEITETTNALQKHIETKKLSKRIENKSPEPHIESCGVNGCLKNSAVKAFRSAFCLYHCNILLEIRKRIKRPSSVEEELHYRQLEYIMRRDADISHWLHIEMLKICVAKKTRKLIANQPSTSLCRVKATVE